MLLPAPSTAFYTVAKQVKDNNVISTLVLKEHNGQYSLCWTSQGGLFYSLKDQLIHPYPMMYSKNKIKQLIYRAFNHVSNMQTGWILTINSPQKIRS